MVTFVPTLAGAGMVTFVPSSAVVFFFYCAWIEVAFLHKILKKIALDMERYLKNRKQYFKFAFNKGVFKTNTTVMPL